MVTGDESSLYLEKPNYTIIVIVVILLVVALFFYYKRTDKKESGDNSEPSPLVPSTLAPSPLAIIYEAIDNWIGKTLLYMNMRGDAIVYNYPFEKGFLEKLFDNVKLPRYTE
jgi:hypothetical protein